MLPVYTHQAGGDFSVDVNDTVIETPGGSSVDFVDESEIAEPANDN